MLYLCRLTFLRLRLASLRSCKVYIFSRKDTEPFAEALSSIGPGSCTACIADVQVKCMHLLPGVLFGFGIRLA